VKPQRWLVVGLTVAAGLSLVLDELGDYPEMVLGLAQAAALGAFLVGLATAVLVAASRRPALATKAGAVVAVVAVVGGHVLAKTWLLGTGRVFVGAELAETLLELPVLALVFVFSCRLVRELDQGPAPGGLDEVHERIAMERVQAAVAAARRSGRPLGVLALSALDDHGERVDPGALRAALRNAVRLRTDALVRWPGVDGLVLICPDTAHSGLDRLSERLAAATQPSGCRLLSGAAVFPADGIAFDAVVTLAEYRRGQGREVRVWSDVG
jgi:hypothetical protein